MNHSLEDLLIDQRYEDAENMLLTELLIGKPRAGWKRQLLYLYRESGQIQKARDLTRDYPECGRIEKLDDSLEALYSANYNIVRWLFGALASSHSVSTAWKSRKCWINICNSRIDALSDIKQNEVLFKIPFRNLLLSFPWESANGFVDRLLREEKTHPCVLATKADDGLLRNHLHALPGALCKMFVSPLVHLLKNSPDTESCWQPNCRWIECWGSPGEGFMGSIALISTAEIKAENPLIVGGGIMPENLMTIPMDCASGSIHSNPDGKFPKPQDHRAEQELQQDVKEATESDDEDYEDYKYKDKPPAQLRPREYDLWS